MSRARRAVLYTVAAIAVVWFAYTHFAPRPPTVPAAAVAAARAAEQDTARGASLRVLLVTISPGDPLWERFGHNMIWVQDEREMRDITWNWGIFSFGDPMFIPRFLFGHTNYMMGAVPAGLYFEDSREKDREVIVQELALTSSQKAALDAFVRTNADSANMFYRYDYFLDNCSTRVRDALDVVLHGALRSTLEPMSNENMSYRSESLRLNSSDPWIFLGMDFALGPPANRPLDAWRAGFIPMRLRDAVRSVWVKAADGTSIPLVKSERVLIPSKRAPEPKTFESGKYPQRVMLGTLVLTLIIAGLGVMLRRGFTAARPLIVGLAAVIHGFWGVLASLVVFMWLFTLHWAWAWNFHLLMFTPASLVIAALVIKRRNAWKPGNWIEGYHLVMAVISFLLVIGMLLWYRTALTPGATLTIMWANASWMLHFGLGTALAGLSGARKVARPLAE